MSPSNAVLCALQNCDFQALSYISIKPIAQKKHLEGEIRNSPRGTVRVGTPGNLWLLTEAGSWVPALNFTGDSDLRTESQSLEAESF